MTHKPKFLRSTNELFGAHAVRLARDVLYLNDQDAQSKGGRRRADKIAGAIADRNNKIRAEFGERTNVPGTKRHKVVGALAKKHELSASQVNRILSKK